MKDVLTGEEWDVRAKVVINATGILYITHMYIHVCACSNALHIATCTVYHFFLFC